VYRLFDNRLKARKQDLRAVRRSPTRLLVAAGVGIAVVVTGSLTYLYRQSEAAVSAAAPTLAQVVVSKPLAREVDSRLGFLGQFSAVEKVELRAQVGGTLTGIYFKDGDIVHKGDDLFSIDAEETRNIPIVFAFVSDPLGSGFVANFPHPGGNVTGFIVMEPGIAGKWLELLKQIAPRVARVAILFNPRTAPYANYYLEPFKAAARAFAVEETVAPVRDGSELESVMALTRYDVILGGDMSAETSFHFSPQRQSPGRLRFARSPPNSP
jgi:hypothetical protein